MKLKLIKNNLYTFRYRGKLYVKVKYRGIGWYEFGHLYKFEHSRGMVKIPTVGAMDLDITE